MSQFPGTLSFQPNATGTLFQPTQGAIPPSMSLKQWTPSEIPNLLLWLDAADASTFAFSSGINVSQWNDKSGNGYNFTTTSGTPTYTSSAPLTKCVVFNSDRTTDVMTTSTAFNQPITVFVVSTQRGSGNGDFAWILSTPGLSSPFTQLAYVQNNLVVEANAAFSPSSPAATFVNPTTGIYTLVLNGASTTLTRDGAFPTGFLTNTPPGFNGIRLGASWGSPTGVYNIADYAEILFYSSALSSISCQQVEGYLAWKWGLQANLPANHPYKSIGPPTILNPMIQTRVSIPTGLATKQWVPSTAAIPNLLLWFDAADTATITGTSQVTAWTNKGSGSTTVTNKDGAVISGNVGPYGLNYLFVPNTAALEFTIDLGTSTNRTWIFVVKNTSQIPTSPVGPNILTFISATVSSADEFAIARAGASTYNMDMGPNGNGGAYYSTSVPNPLNSLNIYIAIRSSTTANQIMTLNGNINTNINNNAPLFVTGSVKYVINVANNSRPEYNLYEFFFLPRAVSVLERQQLEGYLAWKWGVQGDLPSFHPYKQYPPPPA